MPKDKEARRRNDLTVAALGIVMGSIVDVMRAVPLPNGMVHLYLDHLEEGFGRVLYGEALGVMYELLDVMRANVPSND